MEAIRVVLFVCHFTALAVLLCGLVAGRDPLAKASVAVLGAAAAMLVTGVLLVVVQVARDLPVNGPKVAVKAGLAVAVLGCALWARRSARDGGPRLWAGGLTIANAVVAMAWN
ncbi:hypothetical protein [Thermomonospora umbrina]|uniref:Integral membrane protein n=1 Tax=Thermomonospora umbrina TaxID=111806 RepID=A0A3D9SS08_9ACTN|nr:hypothetical protein [Thermomonospora umbrina]REE98722.1 hypothetical protein DFJ69_4217 [Thermomonospora umbrina]